MADEREPQPGDAHPWRTHVAVVVIMVLLGLVVYVTVTTKEIPASVALPLLLAAAFGLWAFRWSDVKGGD